MATQKANNKAQTSSFGHLINAILMENVCWFFYDIYDFGIMHLCCYRMEKYWQNTKRNNQTMSRNFKISLMNNGVREGVLRKDEK